MAYPIHAFLETKSAMAAGFSPDGTRLLVASNITGTNQLYQAPVAGGAVTAITAFDEPVSGRYLPGHEGTLLIQMDEGGNERHQVYLIEEDGSGFRPVIFEPEFIFRAGGVTREGRRFAYASNRRNGVDFDIYVHDFASGESRMVFAPGGWCDASRFSPDGRYLGVIRLTERNGDNDLYLVDTETGEAIHASPHEDDAYYSGPTWLGDGSGFYFTTDQGRDVAALARYDLGARSWEYVREFEWEANCYGDQAGRYLLIATNEDGYSRFELFDAATLASLGEVPVPGPGVGHGALRVHDPVFSSDGSKLAFTWTSGARIPEAWVYDIAAGELRQITNSATDLPGDLLVDAELRHFESFDGERVSAYVFQRDPGAAGPPPAVVMVHGGPESQYKPVFDPVVQYLVHNGYAVVAPNVRGSTGYGKRFHHLDDVRLRMDSVADLGTLHEWLPTVGLDQRRAALFGGSYGGFMVLAGLAFQPQRWAAGIDIVGISNWVTFLENTSAWRRQFREREYGSLEHDREFLESISPLNHAEQIRAPLFIIHGTNDPRVPVGEARQVHRALFEREVPCELAIYDDEGHGLMKLKNRLDAYPRAVAFLDRALREVATPA
ncbi:MAG: alpha/beta fold hydrolase [Tepidiformaceae bacterium]